MKNIMTRAWEIAKEGQVKFGGKVSEYLAEALKMAWAESREEEVYGLAKWNAIESKLAKAGKYSMIQVMDSAKKVKFKEVSHKQGAYYGIEVVTEFGSLTTVYVSERVWDAA